MAKVSIIIPVYNAEQYLERCLDSIKGQSYSDWEAICVDDGSNDGSAAILDAFSASDQRFKIIHKQNEGVSQARNDALEAVTGEYLVFVDSDDFLHPQTLEICVAAALRDNSDLVAYTYDRSFRSRLVIRHLIGLPDPKRMHFKRFDVQKIEYIKTDDIFSWVTEYSNGEVPGNNRKWAIKHCQPWRCLYRSSAVRDIRFTRGIMYEDLPWWGEVLLRIRSATIINLPLYFYYPNRKSYILSSKQTFRISSLRTAIAAAGKVYSNCTDSRKVQAWEQRFMQPFRHKLEKKVRRYGEEKP